MYAIISVIMIHTIDDMMSSVFYLCLFFFILIFISPNFIRIQWNSQIHVQPHESVYAQREIIKKKR